MFTAPPLIHSSVKLGFHARKYQRNLRKIEYLSVKTVTSINVVHVLINVLGSHGRSNPETPKNLQRPVYSRMFLVLNKAMSNVQCPELSRCSRLVQNLSILTAYSTKSTKNSVVESTKAHLTIMVEAFNETFLEASIK